MNDFTIANIALRALLTIIMAFGLIRYGDKLNFLERMGMGLIGGSAFMTIPILVAIDQRGTPFDGWATTLITLGVISFSTGRMWRIHVHNSDNRRMMSDARRHLRERRLIP